MGIISALSLPSTQPPSSALFVFLIAGNEGKNVSEQLMTGLNWGNVKPRHQNRALLHFIGHMCLFAFTCQPSKWIVLVVIVYKGAKEYVTARLRICNFTRRASRVPDV